MQNRQMNWFTHLQDKINESASQFGLNDTQTNLFRDFVTGIAREHFMAGNKNGAGWAFAQAKEKVAKGQPI